MQQMLKSIVLTFLLYHSVSSQSTCLDKSIGAGIPSDCPSRKEMCTNPVYRSLMADQCPLTCGLCGGRNVVSQNEQVRPSAAGCADRLGPTGMSDCPKYPERCRDPQWRSIMVQQCPLTCGLCTPRAQTATATVPEETRTLDQIYQAALAEGGRLVVYAGGDTPTQQDFTKQQFEQRFPGMSVTIVVDYSKYHDARIDAQLAGGQLIPDVVQLQTIQDFPRWKRQGVLLQYKPRGWSRVYPEYRDEDGFHLGTSAIVFSNVVNSTQLPNQADWPKLASDYLKPVFRQKLVITYPNDDDAVLFLFKQIIDKYGWQWYANLVQQQQPTFVRGTASPFTEMTNGRAAATMTTSAGSVAQTQEGNPSRWSFPANDDPFVAWAQQIAIFKQTRHPEAAKLFLNWQLDNAGQSDAGRIWSVRTDFRPPAGFKQMWEYPNSSHRKFLEFMLDREGVERFKSQIYMYSGEPQGPPAAGVLGPLPTTSCQGPLTNCGGT